MMKNLASIFEPIIQDVYASKCPIECKKLIVDKVSQSRIKEIDKNQILSVLETKTSLIQIQTYATNSMFQYEGLGLNQLR